MRIKQGNTYDVELTLALKDGTAVTDANAAVVEVILGNIRKYYPGEVVYGDDVWTMHLSQDDTFFLEGVETLSATVKLLSGDVGDADIGIVAVGKSKRNSKERL